MEAKQTCYMCDSEATSDEHVPPKCLFPKSNELEKGVTMRRNLIKVPSCDTHNSSKSIDDEYIMLVMSCAFYGNEFKSSLFENRSIKAIKRKPKIINSLIINPRKTFIRDIQLGKNEESISFEVDLNRIDSIFHHIACGIYFHHFKEKWLGKSKNTINFFSYLGESNDAELNKMHLEMHEESRRILQDFNYYGDNPKIFSYKIFREDNGEAVVLLEFYEHLQAVVLLLR